MQLFYSPNLSPKDVPLVFNKEESRHIGKVLRKQIGDVLHLTNGEGMLFTARLESNDPKHCIATITAFEEKKTTALHLALGDSTHKIK
jgi:16S rRNA (uracil1498-N3)-methyltransferase